MTIPFIDLAALAREQQDELAATAARVLAKGYYVLGPEVEAFEQEWAAYCGAAHAVGVANGLDALALSLIAMDIGPGDEVIVPANTYIASVLAITRTGATPILVEPDEDTCTLDPRLVGQAITPRTRAIMAVHLYGLPAEMDALAAIAKANGLRLIEDAAQAHGATYRGRRIGAHGDAVGWSFYPTKNLGAVGDAGAVTTNDPQIAERLRMLRNYGSKQRYVCEVAGSNSRLDELQAALLRVKLRRLDAWNHRRQVLAEAYAPVLAALPLRRQVVPPWMTTVHHLLTVRTPHRQHLQAHLAAAGVPTIVHYPIPPHLQGAYRSLGHGRGSFPITERIHDTILSLPLAPSHTDEQLAVMLSTLATWQAPC